MAAYKFNNLDVYVWEFDDQAEDEGVLRMSLVNDPAVFKNFVCYTKKKTTLLKYSLDAPMKVITGVALRADYPIYRKMDNYEFYTVFDAPTIRKIVYNFMKNLRNNKVSIEHAENTEDAFLFESYILRPEHRKIFPEFADIADGSWIVSYKVTNDELWKKIVAGDLNGFSVEMSGGLISSFLKDQEKKDLDLVLTDGSLFKKTSYYKTMKTINTKQRLAGLRIRCNYGGPGSRRHKKDMSESQWDADTESRKHELAGNVSDFVQQTMNAVNMIETVNDLQDAAELYDKALNNYNGYIEAAADDLMAGGKKGENAQAEIDIMTKDLRTAKNKLSRAANDMDEDIYEYINESEEYLNRQ